MQFRIIMAGTDLSLGSLGAVSCAAALARAQGARLLLAHVALTPRFGRDAGPCLAALASSTGMADCRPVVCIGYPSAGLVRLAEENQADLLVVAHRNRLGQISPMLGSTAAGVMREARCPVAVVTTDRRLDVIQTVLVPVDFEAASQTALDLARDVAAAYGARLILLHVTEEKPAPAILDAARDYSADLIVMGTAGRGLLPRLLMGSTAEAVMVASPCPVLTVRSDLGESRPATVVHHTTSHA